MLAVIQTEKDTAWTVRQVDKDLKYGQYVFYQPSLGSRWVKGWIGYILSSAEEKAVLEAHPDGIAMAIRMSEFQRRNSSNQEPPF